MSFLGISKMIITKSLQSEEKESSESEKYDEIYSKLAKERVIFLAEEITKKTGSSLSALLLYYDRQDSTKDITIYINSIGGDACALSNIYDVMQMITSPIKTVCIGKAYSAAAIMLAAGTPGKRFATKHSDIMIHGLQVEFPVSEHSSSADTEIDYSILEAHNTLIMEVLAKHTKKKYQQVLSDCQRDLYMDPKQALDYGIIDVVL
jgi:ATP-dependent Clp protease, protease subunit